MLKNLCTHKNFNVHDVGFPIERRAESTHGFRGKSMYVDLQPKALIFLIYKRYAIFYGFLLSFLGFCAPFLPTK